MSIFLTIDHLVQKGIEVQLIEERDALYVRNQLLGLCRLTSFEVENGKETEPMSIPQLLEEIVQYAIKESIIEDIFDEKEIFSANLMNCFLSKPSDINREFWRKYEDSPASSTNYFYQLSKNSNYIQTERVAKNIHFTASTEYGEMDITINLSKPEKDPEQIKREKAMKKQSHSFPECVLCPENEGYVGRTGYPARSNHRIVELELEKERWFLQYSPYVYYNEHCIVLAEEHRDMKMDHSTFQRLLAFVETFPHYFLGSNADLPIVGGSILSHDHYQGGNYSFAMTRASEDFHFDLTDYPQVEATKLNWPMSVIRLQSRGKKDLIQAATMILDKWKDYSDDAADIIAYTNETPHNTITPIARKRDTIWELDLVLRNNRTTKEHPLGIFHPHKDVHHIKRENIGLIEVMGLAVLPARLQEELKEIKKFLLNQAHQVEPYHQEWAAKIKTRHSITKQNVDEIVELELGKKFTRVLEDAGVFKRTEGGKKAFQRFITHLNN
ncbi:UDP-glucose--hexose-1-phosphate uridylyltransferase [Radiobacillus kanasensis]|uniref:UDP-glucose--hexose-1-phosphate uridylyltransferase n=1 Tax=Radiobacillus kanasensis TaxID=2844358 RepID=UPI001E5538B6|nr:UDP-glucose--hexose-1-phosphate uridylyltransferase [Radiobacillus kanasensis]UFT99083.1 UDP-glucose--hexose-1-phosphate uridylyltransferase [Radiobacillus kanasensis]